MANAFPAFDAGSAPRPFSPQRRPWRSLRRGVWVATGVVLMALGSVAALLPGHLGAPVLIVGLAMVLRNSMAAKRAFVRMQRKKPNWVFPLRRLMRPKPEFFPVVWQGMLRTERLLFSFARERRVLKLTRRALRGRMYARVFPERAPAAVWEYGPQV